MTAQVYIGGVPTDPEIYRLRDAFPDGSLRAGQTIGYDDVAKVIGCSKTSTRFETVTDRWRRLVEANTGHVIGRPGDGTFKVLTEREKLDLSEKKLRTAARQARRSYVIGGRLNVRDLSDEERSRHALLQQRNAAVVTAAQVKSKAELPTLEDTK